MNFIDRTSLGETLAGKLEQFRGKDAVVVCLQESSLLTCLTIASKIRAWLFPLVYEEVYTADHARLLLGAYDQDGEFCANPAGPAGGDKVSAEVKKSVKKQKVAAMKAITKQLEGFEMTLDKHQLDGRDVILAADILTDTMPLLVAQQYLKGTSPASLTAVVGNATLETAQLVRLSAGKSEILDVLSGITFDPDRYFERTDNYTAKEKRTLTQHIAAYWQ